MIFRIIQLRKMARDAKEDPAKFMAEEASSFFTGLFVLPIISAILLLAILIVFAFTSWLGGPYGFFKFLFFLSLFGVGTFFYMLYKTTRVIKSSIAQRATKGGGGTIKVESKVVEDEKDEKTHS